MEGQQLGNANQGSVVVRDSVGVVFGNGNRATSSGTTVFKINSLDAKHSRFSVVRPQPYHKWAKFTFPSSPSLTFLQVNSLARLKVDGEVVVSGSEEGSVTVELDMWMSKKQVGKFIGISANATGIDFSTKGSWDWVSGCALTVNVTISIPQKNVLREFRTSTENLGIQLKPTLGLAANEVHLEAERGSVSTVAAYGVGARRMAVKVGVGNIEGEFGLYDQVKLSTRIGDIQVTLHPQPSNIEAAGLYEASSNVGSINTKFPRGALPENRKYESKVQVGVGNINGRYLLGTHLSLKVDVGDISTEIVPAGAKESWLATEVKTGDTEVRFTGALGVGSTQTRGTHKGKVGSMNVCYPADFEGTLIGTSNMGRVKLGGGGVTIQEERQKLLDMTSRGAKGVGIHGGGGCVESEVSIGDLLLWVGQKPQ